MLTLYHAPTTRSFRIKWLLGELDLPYEEETLDFYGMDRHAETFRTISPAGTLPAVSDGDLALTESGAIINHILRTYGGGRFIQEKGSREEALVDEWMYWSEGLFAVHQRIYWDHCAPPPGCIVDPIPSVGMEGKRQAIRYAAMLEARLRNDGWVVGEELTGADFMLSFPLFLANLGDWFADLPKIRAYVGRIQARPAFAAAIQDTVIALKKMASTPPAYPSFRSTEPTDPAPPQAVADHPRRPLTTGSSTSAASSCISHEG